MIYRNK